MELEKQGWKQRLIAEAFGVDPSTVRKWMMNRANPELEAWQAKPYGYRASKQTAEQLAIIPDLLSHGAEAYGFRGELWTCAGVAEVLQEEFGVVYHKAHVPRILKDWTAQIPIERDSQRDEAAIEKYRVEVWPRLKKRRSKRAP
jgi:transposase